MAMHRLGWRTAEKEGDVITSQGCLVFSRDIFCAVWTKRCRLRWRHLFCFGTLGAAFLILAPEKTDMGRVAPF